MAGQLQRVEIMYRLSEAVARTSDLKKLLFSVAGFCKEAGMEHIRVSFEDKVLASLLKMPFTTEEENRVLARWRNEVEPEAQAIRGDWAVPVVMLERPAGVLWVRPAGVSRAPDIELVKALALGIGEVAYKSKLRRRSEQRYQELAVAAECDRIARELNDTVGRRLYGIALGLGELLTDENNLTMRDDVAELRARATRGIVEVRNAAYALSFLHLQTRGMVGSLRELIRRFSAETGIYADLRVEGQAHHLPKAVQSALYHMAHEVLVNLERHARASGVIAKLKADDEQIEFSILDDGVGLDQRQAADWQSAPHFGLGAIARAIEEAGGRFKVEAARPRGLIMRAVVPLNSRRRAIG
jgi:signal transduction histidine kinase